jgi:hypothetical protein
MRFEDFIQYFNRLFVMRAVHEVCDQLRECKPISKIYIFYSHGHTMDSGQELAHRVAEIIPTGSKIPSILLTLLRGK